jgi:TolA-binding protein
VLADGHADEALAHQASALVKGKDADDAEPPALGAVARLTLGDMQLKAGKWLDAEQSFRTDLAEHPKSGWALRGLERSLRAQGRAAEADRLHDELRQAWGAADAGLLAMR